MALHNIFFLKMCHLLTVFSVVTLKRTNSRGNFIAQILLFYSSGGIESISYSVYCYSMLFLHYYSIFSYYELVIELYIFSFNFKV